MGLVVETVMHCYLSCATCEASTAEVCGKRQPSKIGEVRAERSFRSAGWLGVARPRGGDPREPLDMQSHWHCPACVAVGKTTRGAKQGRHGPVWVPRTHVHAVCVCGKASADVCGKRDHPKDFCARVSEALQTSGWRCDPGRGREPAKFEGDGRWYCPSCAAVPHL